MKKTFLLLLFSLIPLLVLAQNAVTGKVKTVDGESLPGVQILEKGTTNGTITDFDGNFTITVSNDAVLIVSYVGYKTQEVIVGEQTSLEVSLVVEETGLDEVVVIGYGTTKKKLNTGANLNVKGETIQELSPATAMDALKGISPGVNITQNNGQPGAGTKVFIRGQGTIGNSAPLYIVDGVAVYDIDYLSPNDIESIDVLKDAASAAIYGSRAANGVILVTTKKGKSGHKPVITYDAYTGWKNVYKKPDLLNAQEYAVIMNEASVNSGQGQIDFAGIIPNWSEIESGAWTGTNWFDEISIKDAYVQSHSLNVTGGTEQSIYSIGASYFSDGGIIGAQTNSDYKRINLRLNTEHVLIKREHNVLVAGQNLSYTNSESPTVRTGDIYWNDLRNMLVADPFMPVYGTGTNVVEGLSEPYSYVQPWNDQTWNPIAEMVARTKDAYGKDNSIVGNVYLEIQPIKNLKVRSSYGVNMLFGNYRQWTPAYDLSPLYREDRDQIDQSMYSLLDWTLTNTVSYSFNLGSEHSIVALIGNELQKKQRDLSINGHNEGSYFNKAEYAYLSNVGVISDTYTTVNGIDSYGGGVMSYFGRLSYNFKETYMLTAVLRADASSNFRKGKRWGYFPSVSAGWVASNESFLQSMSWLDFFKVRASWGQNGNERIGGGQYSADMTYGGISYFFGPNKGSRYVGAAPERIPNPDVTWETSEQLDFGFDAHFLSARLQTTFDWYKKDTKDWLVLPQKRSTDGAPPAYINGGQVTNKGFELSLRWNDKIGDFKYGVALSVAKNKNEVTRIANYDKKMFGEANVLSTNTSAIYLAEEGYPIGYFWGFETNGILQNDEDVANWVRPEGSVDADGNDVSGQPYFADQTAGDVRFVDQNGDGLLNDDDKVKIGDPNPDYVVGIQLNAEYKGFYVNVTANGQMGHQVAKSYRSFADSPKQNYTTDILGRWHGEGTSNTLPRVVLGSNRNSNFISDLYIEDADFLRISNLTVGYNLNNILKNLPFAETKLYISAQNLYTFTKYSGMDPEVGYAPDPWASGVDLGLYPSARTVLIGLSVKF